MTEPLVLGIETSCDETGVGIVRGRTLLADEVASSVDEHARFGGVVPEVASRAHLEAIVPTLERACERAGVRLDDIDALAVTAGPGLAGALLVGTSAAKALSLALGKPVHAVNHLAGHVVVDELEHGAIPEAAVGLLVSGGHSSLLLVRDDVTDVTALGATLDDAAGEAFDKVARLLGLPFPGGPWIDRSARDGDPAAVAFPRGLTAAHDMAEHRYDFSFSGLKTAVARWVRAEQAAGRAISVPDVAASFQEAVADVLTRKAVLACTEQGADTIILGGGVAANSRLRALAEERCAAAGLTLRVPSPRLCTDNGAMIAAVGAKLVRQGIEPATLTFPTTSVLDVSTVSIPGRAELARVYDQARVLTDDPVLGRVDPALSARRLGLRGITITAWNPGLARPTAAENQAANVRLHADLLATGHECWPADGFNVAGTFSEPGWIAWGLPLADALSLGRSHGQYAVYVFEPDGSRRTAWC